MAVLVPALEKITHHLSPDERCQYGRNVEIGYMVLIDNRRPELITIEDEVIITTMCVVIAHDLSRKYNEGKEIIGQVTIRKGAFIGMNTTIMPGVTIGEGSVVAAGSVVTKDVEPFTIYGGVPAKKIRDYFPKE